MLHNTSKLQQVGVGVFKSSVVYNLPVCLHESITSSVFVKVMVFSKSYDLVSLNVSVQLSLRAESDNNSSILPRTSTHTPKASYLHST